MSFTIPDTRGQLAIHRIALVALAVLALVRLPMAGDPIQAPRALVAGVALFAVLLSADSTRRASRTPAVVVALVVSLAGWLMVSAIAGHPASSVWGVHGRFQGLVSAGVLLCALLAGTVLVRREMTRFALAASLAAIMMSAIVAFQLAMGADTIGTFGNSASAGSWLAVVAGVSAAAGLTSAAGPKRWLGLSAAAFAAASAASVGSRTAVLAVIVAAAVLALAFRPGWRSGRLIGLVALVAVLAAGVLMAGGSATQKFTPQALVSGSALSRTYIWRDTAKMVAASPILGVGTGRFLYEFPAFQSAEHARAENPDTRADQAHSYPLQYAAEAGIPAALLYCALVLFALARAWTGARRRDGAAFIALGGLSAYAVHALLGVASVETDVMGWMLMGVAVMSVSGAPHEPPVAEKRARPVDGQALIAGATGFALAAAVACGWYLAADVRYGNALDRFAMGDFAVAEADFASASQLNPLTDTYRVGTADAASYVLGDSTQPAIESLDAGLRLEPRSYDLALAKARLLKLSGAPAQDIASAFRLAVELYPHGTTVRREASVAGVVAP